MRITLIILFIWASTMANAQVLTLFFAREQLNQLGLQIMQEPRFHDVQYYIEGQSFREEREYTVGFQDEALKKSWIAIPYRGTFNKIGYLFYTRDLAKPSGRFFFAEFLEAGGKISIARESELTSGRENSSNVISPWFDCIKQNVAAGCSATKADFLQCLLQRSVVVKNCTAGFLFAQ